MWYLSILPYPQTEINCGLSEIHLIKRFVTSKKPYLFFREKDAASKARISK
jgi:hypothetical protein